MNQSRRDVLRMSSVFGLAFAAGVLKHADVFAADWKANVFEAKTFEDAVKALGSEKFAIARDVTVTGPDIAENGAVVPISVASMAPKTEFIAILVEKNVNPLSAVFNIPAGTEPAVSTRVKMSGTSHVYALVNADGQWLIASKEIKVTLGGCGG